jgi:hypothetical protein
MRLIVADILSYLVLVEVVMVCYLQSSARNLCKPSDVRVLCAFLNDLFGRLPYSSSDGLASLA